jgi:hypothetical protein
MFFIREVRASVKGKTMRRSSILSLLFVSVFGLVLLGCEGVGTKKTVTQEVKVSKGKVISAGCIVKFYKTDGSRYLSEQKHLINPSGGAIEISAQEPGGDVSCKLDGGFTTSGEAKVKGLAIPMCDRNLAQAIWASVAGGCGFVDEKSGETGEKVKMDGRLYEPITLKEKSQWTKTLLYKNLSDGSIETVQVVDSENGQVLTAKSYNYFWFEELGRRFPMKIDVFSSKTTVGSQEQVLEISYLLPIGWN